MLKPIAPVIPGIGIASAFPDVCETPTPPRLPIPYTNVAHLDQADSVTDKSGKELLVGPLRFHVLLEKAKIDSSTGDETGIFGGIVCGDTGGECRVIQSSKSVLYGPEKKGIVRFMDATLQNIIDNQPNASGNVMSSFPTVLVGD